MRRSDSAANQADARSRCGARAIRSSSSFHRWRFTPCLSASEKAGLLRRPTLLSRSEDQREPEATMTCCTPGRRRTACANSMASSPGASLGKMLTVEPCIRVRIDWKRSSRRRSCSTDGAMALATDAGRGWAVSRAASGTRTGRGVTSGASKVTCSLAACGTPIRPARAKVPCLSIRRAGMPTAFASAVHPE